MGWEIFVPTAGLTLGPLLFLMGVYGYILMTASVYMAEGCELLLDFVGPEKLALIVAIAGVVPDGMMVLVSGLGPIENVQHEITVGLGTTIGSSVMLLCLGMSGAIIIGSRRLGGPEHRALVKEKKVKRRVMNSITGEVQEITMTEVEPALPHEFTFNSLFNTGATGLSTSRKAAVICMVSSLSFLIVQIPSLWYMHDVDGGVNHEHMYAGFGFVITLTGFFVYLLYIYMDKDSIEVVHEKQKRLVEKMAYNQGLLNLRALHQDLDPLADTLALYKRFDLNNDGDIDFNELVNGFKQLGYEFDDVSQQHVYFQLMDKNRDGKVCFHDFQAFMEDYLLNQFIISSSEYQDINDDSVAPSASIPSRLPADVKEKLKLFVSDDVREEEGYSNDTSRDVLMMELPSEQRHLIHMWAGGVHGKTNINSNTNTNTVDYIIATHSQDISSPTNTKYRHTYSNINPDIRTIVLVKKFGENAIQSHINSLRPPLLPYIPNYPVWCCVSTQLRSYYNSYKQWLSADEILAQIFNSEITCKNKGYITVEEFEFFTKKFGLNFFMTPFQVKFAFHSRDTDLDGVLCLSDMKGLLESMVSAHVSNSPVVSRASSVNNDGDGDGVDVGDDIEMGSVKGAFINNIDNTSQNVSKTNYNLDVIDLSNLPDSSSNTNYNTPLANTTHLIASTHTNYGTNTDESGSRDEDEEDGESQGLLNSSSNPSLPSLPTENSKLCAYPWLSAVKSPKSQKVVEEVEEAPLLTSQNSHSEGGDPRSVLMKSFAYIILGTIAVTIFSDPMCDVILQTGNIIGISPFYLSFIITPIVSNSSEIITSIKFAQKKTDTTFGIVVSSLYSAATMNNTFCLSIFMGLMYFRNLDWQYFVETITVLVVILVAGYIGLKQTIPLYQAIILFLMYPFALIMIYTLNTFSFKF